MKKYGLTDKEVIISRKKYGSNKLTPHKKEKFIDLMLETLADPIIKILLIALAIKTIFLFKNFDWYETIGILIAIFIASFISSISEYGSNKAFEKLQENISKINVRVIRNKNIKQINIEDIVVGDIIDLQAGEQIPADGTLIEGKIEVNQSSLTGETKEITKSINDKLYRSSTVYSGIGKMQVNHIAHETLYGKLVEEIKEKKPDSPLKIRLTSLAQQISKIGYLGALLVSISYLFKTIIINNNFQINQIIQTISNLPLLFSYIINALTLSVTIIIVAVPEGLPMMITLVLSSNMKRMMKNNVLVRKLTGIETAGNINILFTDKTGTITKGNLEVTKIIDAKGKTYTNKEKLKQNKPLYNLIKISLTANNESTLDKENKAIGGNTTDRALLNYIKEKNNYKIIERETFQSSKKYSTVTINYNNKNIKLIKGAPEIILNRCSHYIENNQKKGFFHRKELEKQINKETNSGSRIIALALQQSNYLTLIGLVCIKDEIRKEAIEGLNLIKKANIQTILITGDNKETATKIAKEVGIIEDNKDIILTSETLKQKTDSQIKQLLPNIKVLARALPQDKTRLIKIAKEANLIVGMTGDGVNDAPALKQANVGFAIGSGTEVAKEASDIIILDDNLLSISKAILYGRTIFKSIRKFIVFQLTINISAVSLSIIGPFIGIETPVTVIQMLWINMVMDTLAAIAFSYEPPLKEYMQEKPKKNNEKIINEYMKNEIIVSGITSSLMCILFLKLPLIKEIYKTQSKLMTAFFTLFIFISIFNSFNARTDKINIFKNITKNKPFILTILFIIIVQIYIIYHGGSTFRSYGLSLKELEITILLALITIPIDIIRKIIIKKKGLNQTLTF